MIERELKERIKSVCKHHFWDPQNRKAIIQAALYSWDGITTINLEGSASAFTTHLVYSALPPKQMQAVLEELKNHKGDPSEFETLIIELDKVDPAKWRKRFEPYRKVD